jgi:hypothetical protein
MSTKDLWGELPVESEIKLPVTILKEQASILGEKTNKILEARVDPITIAGEAVAYSFDIIAPALSNYRFKVLYITHPAIFVYPLHIEFQENVAGHWVQAGCEDEGQFIEMLGQILSSELVHKAVGALIAQSKAAA